MNISDVEEHCGEYLTTAVVVYQQKFSI